MKRGIAANSAFAFTGDVASKVGALVVVVLGARFLTVGEFAELATALAAAGVLCAVLDLGATTLLTRDGAHSKESRGALFRALLVARAPFAVGVLIVAAGFGLALGHARTAVAVAFLALSSALGLSLMGLHRSSQDIRPEATQRIGAATLSVAGVAVACIYVPRADALLVVLALTSLVALLPLLRLAPAVADFTRRVEPRTALRRAAPIGLVALATIAYYRSGTLALATLSDAEETAVFGIASSIAFGLLMLPNAMTTAFLPRLSAENDPRARLASARRVLIWTLVFAVALSAVAAVLVPLCLSPVLGPEYGRASGPFVLLCVGIPLIAVSGVLGTTLLGAGHIRWLAVQVAATLAVNLGALALLVPPLGATGAASATIVCEAVGLVVLVAAARAQVPGLIASRRVFQRPFEASGATTP